MKEYVAEIARFNKDGWGEGRCWSFYVSPDRIGAFTVKAAKEILEWGTKEFTSRFNEEIDFNFICLEMGNKKGKYWRDKNRLLIYENGMPIYMNDNGTICRDADALADCLM